MKKIIFSIFEFFFWPFDAIEKGWIFLEKRDRVNTGYYFLYAAEGVYMIAAGIYLLGSYTSFSLPLLAGYIVVGCYYCYDENRAREKGRKKQ